MQANPQRKRLRRKCAAQASDNSKSSDQTRVQELINAKQQVSDQRLPLSQPTCGLSYEEKVNKVDAEIKQRVYEMLAAWEHEEIIFSDDDAEISNKDFWYSYKKNDGLRWIAKYFMGRPPTQCEDERHFTRTGITVSPRSARIYPQKCGKELHTC